MITRVYIDNYRCFSNFEIRPDHVNLLIGNNGAGKSAFMEVLHSIVGSVVLGEAVEEAFPWHTRTRWDSRLTQRIELDVIGNGGTYTYLLELSHDLRRETVTLQRERVEYDSRTVFLYDNGIVQLHNNEGRLGTQFPFRGTRSFLSQLEPRPENTALTWFLDSLRSVWLLKLNPTGINPESPSESESLDPDGSNFPSWYRHLSQERPEDLPQLFQRLSDTLPGFRNLKTVSMGKGKSQRELVAVFGGSKGITKYEVDFDELSDGERATIVLYCLLTDAEGSEGGTARVLLLDEPENYVGLQLIQPWLVRLADALRDEGQLFLVSHHPEVIDYLAADHALLFERSQGGPTRVRPDPFNRDKGLKASELVAQGLLDGD